MTTRIPHGWEKVCPACGETYIADTADEEHFDCPASGVTKTPEEVAAEIARLEELLPTINNRGGQLAAYYRLEALKWVLSK